MAGAWVMVVAVKMEGKEQGSRVQGWIRDRVKEQGQSTMTVVSIFTRQGRIKKKQVFLFCFVGRLGRISSCVGPTKFGKPTDVFISNQ